jgi:hypothetical protein
MSCLLYGFAFGNLTIVQYLPAQRSLDLQVSLDGHHFATGQFPPSMRPEQHVSHRTLHPPP